MMTIPTPLRTEGFYTIKKYSGNNELIQEIGPFKNMITNSGLNKLGTLGINYCYVGAGSTAPTILDTSMENFIGETSGRIVTGSSIHETASPYSTEQSCVWRFNPGEATGNISEVGVGFDSNTQANSLWSRALIIDSLNAPTTVTVLPDEYLDVTYTLRYYPDLTSHTYDIVISGVTYSVTSRTASVTSVQMQVGDTGPYPYVFTVNGGPVVLGPVTDTLQNATESAGNMGSVLTYVDNSKGFNSKFDGALDWGNFDDGITGITWTTVGMIRQSYQATITPAIPKTNSKVFSMTIRSTWDRYTP